MPKKLQISLPNVVMLSEECCFMFVFESGCVTILVGMYLVLSSWLGETGGCFIMSLIKPFVSLCTCVCV